MSIGMYDSKLIRLALALQKEQHGNALLRKSIRQIIVEQFVFVVDGELAPDVQRHRTAVFNEFFDDDKPADLKRKILLSSLFNGDVS